MASAIFFGGRRINIPGAYSVIDASALAGLAPGAVGIVALLGEAEGGKPLSVESEFSDATRPETILKRYRSGDLRHAGQFCFAPSTDPAIPGGAQRIVGVKVNPALQSSRTLYDGQLVPIASVDLLSRDWGLFTSQISIEVEAGTNLGKKYTVVFEDKTEIFDDVGASPVLDVIYANLGSGYDNVDVTNTATQFRGAAVKQSKGKLADITQPAAGVLTIVSSNALDITQLVTLYGFNGLDQPIKETLALNGTTPVVGAVVFAGLTGVRMDTAAAGTVTITDVGLFTNATLTTGILSQGLNLLGPNAPAAGVVTIADLTADQPGQLVMVRGLDANGIEVVERFYLATAFTTPVVGTQVFSAIIQMELGFAANANTIQMDVLAFLTSHATFKTTRQVADRLNTLPGFTANSLRRNTFKMVDLDYDPTAQDCQGTLVNIYADLMDFIENMNTRSLYISATRNAAPGALPPANTAGPLYLTGGTEGTTTIAQWQTAINLLKKRRVNIIVPMTNDPAVHALLAFHLIERAGKLRSEANGYIGIGTNAGAGEAKAKIKSQIQLLNTRHISALSQEAKMNNPDTGEAVFYPPHFFGVIAAGMQAGSPIGEPLTHKRPFVSDIRNDNSWSIEDDTEELIDAGLMMAEKVDGVGIRFIRSVTTHLDDDNVVFTEMSANESANTAIFELRRQLELRIGQRGLGGTVANIKGLTYDTLERLVKDEIIVAYKSVSVEQIGDTFPISVEIAPILPINFIPVTVHLVAIRTAA